MNRLPLSNSKISKEHNVLFNITGNNGCGTSVVLNLRTIKSWTVKHKLIVGLAEIMSTITKMFKYSNMMKETYRTKNTVKDLQKLSKSWLPFSFDTTYTTLQMMPPTIFHCHGNMFTELLPSNHRGVCRQIHRLSFDMTWTMQKITAPAFLCCCKY
jgi:hypothetical protein